MRFVYIFCQLALFPFLISSPGWLIGQAQIQISNTAQIEYLNTGSSVFLGEGAGGGFIVNNGRNVFVGYNSGFSASGGQQNTGVGYESLYTNASGANNIGIGYLSLRANSSGSSNVAIGAFALNASVSNSFNTALGSLAMRYHLSGINNTAVGGGAMQNGTQGSENVALGAGALQANTGNSNVAVGSGVMIANAGGGNNVSIGYEGLANTISGNRNVGVGTQHLASLVHGDDNISVGHRSGFGDEGESNFNVYVGGFAGGSATLNSATKSQNVHLGFESGFASTGSGNVYIGYRSGKNTTGSNRLYIENSDSAVPLIYGDFSTDRVGIGVNTLIHKLEVGGTVNASSGLSGPQTALRAQGAEAVWFDGTQFSWGFGGSWNRFADSVRIGSNTAPSHIFQVDGIARSAQSTWATTSDIRVKKDVCTIKNALSVILQFRPVTFSWTDIYKAEHPEAKDLNYGFISQEVEEIIPSMVTHVREKIGTGTIDDFRVLNTDAFVPLLVRAVQEQQSLIEEYENTIQELSSRLGRLEQMLLHRTETSPLQARSK